MRPDQRIRLQELSEKLADVVLEEADPAEWPGAGIPLAALSQQQRGDRYWCKKNAAASFALLQRTQDLIASGEDHKDPDEQQEAGLDEQIAAKERQAARVLEQAMARAKQAANGSSKA